MTKSDPAMRKEGCIFPVFSVFIPKKNVNISPNLAFGRREKKIGYKKLQGAPKGNKAAPKTSGDLFLDIKFLGDVNYGRWDTKIANKMIVALIPSPNPNHFDDNHKSISVIHSNYSFPFSGTFIVYRI